MSKRHQSSRRKTYGRRQHEVRERQDRSQHTRGLRIRARRVGRPQPRPIRSPSSTRAVRASASRSATDRWPSTRALARARSRCRAVPASADAPRLGAATRSVPRSAPAVGPTASASCSARSSSRSCSRSSRSPSRSACRRRPTTSGASSSSARASMPRAADVRSDLEPTRPRAGHPQAGDRRRPRPAVRTARPAGALGDRPTDARPDRFAPTPPRPAGRLRRRLAGAHGAGSPTGRSLDRERLASEAARADDANDRDAEPSVARSTTGPGRSSWRRRSSATASSPHRTS